MSAALPVLYSFRRCPYAMRARLALAVSGQACELREVVLRNKPQGLLYASPKATVPVLVLPSGQVLEQSLEIMLWALAQHDPEGWLTPSHGNLQDMLALIAECDGPFKQALDRCKYPSRYPDADIGAERARAVAWLGGWRRVSGQISPTCSAPMPPWPIWRLRLLYGSLQALMPMGGPHSPGPACKPGWRSGRPAIFWPA